MSRHLYYVNHPLNPTSNSKGLYLISDGTFDRVVLYLGKNGLIVPESVDVLLNILNTLNKK